MSSMRQASGRVVAVGLIVWGLGELKACRCLACRNSRRPAWLVQMGPSKTKAGPRKKREAARAETHGTAGRNPTGGSSGEQDWGVKARQEAEEACTKPHEVAFRPTGQTMSLLHPNYCVVLPGAQNWAGWSPPASPKPWTTNLNPCP